MSDPILSQISLVYTASDGRQIYVGDENSAILGDQLEKLGVAGVLNVAYDLDDKPTFSEPQPPPKWRFSTQVQYAKVGLIDGTHNPTGIMGLAAAVYMADQLWCFPKKDVPCPPLLNVYPTDGNLLIHCYSGKSRSVTVAALFIWYKWGATGMDPNLTSFQATYAMVKEARGDSTQPWTPAYGPCDPPSKGRSDYTETPPTVGMQETALELSQTYSQLFPIPS